jgi:RND family efflux transporter MFP subunit
MTVALTAMVIAGAGGMVAGGMALVPAGAAVPPTGPVAAPAMPVAVVTIARLPGHAVTRRFAGQVEAAAETALGFETGGRVTEMLVDEGDMVPAGAVLARLDTAALHPERAALVAERAALQADADLARLTLTRNDTLTERGHRSVAAQDQARLALARLAAQIAALDARIAGVDVRLDKSVLVAPFAARVGTRSADPGLTVAAGQPVLTLLAEAPPRLRVGLPPDLAATLAPGDAVTVAVNGTILSATIRHLRPDLDPATRSRAVVVDLPPAPDAAMQVAPGQTADLILTQTVAEPGFWAPLSALREGVRGSWTILALDPAAGGDRAVPAAVEVIHAQGDRIFLRGALPNGARIIATAPDRVAPGQPVRALTHLAQAR